MRILFVIGTRPETIKLAPVIKTFERHTDHELLVLCSGQHDTLLQDLWADLSITPDYTITLIREDESLSALTGHLMLALTAEISKISPDYIFVQGDTQTALCAATVAFHQGIPLGHVEAGLRTYDKRSPFPEEMNRQIITKYADHHYAPTAVAADHLRQESIAEEDIVVTGNTVIDALSQTLQPKPTSGVLNQEKVLLMTLHRRENQGARARSFFEMLGRLSRRPDLNCRLLLPANKSLAREAKAVLGPTACTLLEPMGYREFVRQLQSVSLLLTDSGGIQEEAAALGIPIQVLRDKTERQEGVESGHLQLAGKEIATLEAAVIAALDPQNNGIWREAIQENPFGDGKASDKILAYFLSRHPIEGAD